MMTKEKDVIINAHDTVVKPDFKTHIYEGFKQESALENSNINKLSTKAKTDKL